MEILGKLFGSPARVKMIRLFLLNPGQAFDQADIVLKSKVTPAVARKELSVFQGMGLVKKKMFTKEIIVKPRKGAKKSKLKKPPVIKKKRVQGWQLDINFPLLTPLQNILIDTKLVKTEEMKGKFKGGGKLKLIIVSGIFIQNPDSALDILIVGDSLKKRTLESALRAIEAEIGKELVYALLDTKEFTYRLGMYDKFVRDVLDYPHEVLVDKIGL